MHKCEVCGRESHKKYKHDKKTLCKKHKNQYKKYGKALDKNPRAFKDLNDFIIKDDIAIFNCYNVNCEFVDSFIIDKEDIEKIRYKKWRLSSKAVVSGSSNKTIFLHHYLLNSKPDFPRVVVDHINGNSLDNRKSNLRLCLKNVRNQTKNKSKKHNYPVGVGYDKNRNRFTADIYNKQKFRLGRYKTLEDATYARYVAEKRLFGEYVFIDEYKQNLINNCKNKQNIKEKVHNKIEHNLHRNSRLN